MNIGYPCINRSIDCTSNSTFRLRNFTKENLIAKVENNICCLKKILGFNADKGLLFFRISSDLVPFASHPVMEFDWLNHFKDELKSLGSFIRKNRMRISMHPDQFTIINARDSKIVKRSIEELEYHCDLLDSLGLDSTAKIQIHVGGVYDDKTASKLRFAENYLELPEKIKKRLVIENDDRHYGLKDCMEIYDKIRVPVLFDVFHHEVCNSGEILSEALEKSAKTWSKKNGTPMIDYSSQKRGSRKGSHAETLEKNHFVKFLKDSDGFDFDLMLEIKDKEKSAIKALKLVNEKRR
ncbi:UV DNA damage repair endonuclease UvsE [candidate division WOR-3 bacterium]|nr:UV DNA damage repair endonuclease UvsE [candidate division WOR-3 bacterium]